MLREIVDKRELIRLLESNIENDTNESYEYEGHSFYRNGETGYAVFDSRGNSKGFFNHGEAKSFLKTRVIKKSDGASSIKKRKTMKAKSRKTKVGDLILPEFMSFLHSKECVVDGCRAKEIEVHHIFGRQPYRYDNLCVPLCPAHHRGSDYSWHEGSVRKFRKAYTKDFLSGIANRFFREWLDSGGEYGSKTELLYCVMEAIDMTDETGLSASQAARKAIAVYTNEED